MREELRDPLRLRHMLESAQNVIKFLENKSLEDLQIDQILFYAVVKNIEIIGEASYKLTSKFKSTHPEIPWREIEGMRHILVHEYYQIKPEEVYLVFKQDLPLIISQLERLVKLYPIISSTN